MKTTKARLDYTNRARRDLDDCRKFLRRKPGGKPRQRVRDILNAVRRIQEQPRLYPVVGLSLSGLELRRRNAGQFVILYTYFEPDSTDQSGVVSIRAIPHASRAEIQLGVHESRTDTAEHPASSPLFIR
jgi:plasmid stabilization system protein ParE